MSVGAYFHDKTLFFEFVQGKTDRQQVGKWTLPVLALLSSSQGIESVCVPQRELGWAGSTI